MSIKLKLLGGFITAATLVGVVGLLGVMLIATAHVQLHELEDRGLSDLARINRVSTAASELHVLYGRYVATLRQQDDSRMNIIDDRASVVLAEVDAAIKALQEATRGELERATAADKQQRETGELASVQRIISHYRDMMEIWSELRRRRYAGGIDASMAAMIEAQQLAHAAFQQEAHRFATSVSDELIESVDDMDSNVESAMMSLAATAPIALILAGITAAVVVLPLTRRLAVMRQQVGPIGQGRFDIRLPVRGRDEMDQLSEAFNKMAADLQRSQRELLVNARAEATSRAKSEFLASMSHEIRTPITAINGYADLMLDPQQNIEDRHECIRVIRSSAKHLLGLISDILDLSKIEANKMTLDRSPCDLAHLLCDVLSLVRPQAIEKRLDLRVVLDSPIPKQVQTDPLRVKQVLLNLLNNAVKFTSNGGVCLRVRFEQDSGPSGRVEFSVVDSGIGISEPQIATLFQPFSQADQSTTRRYGGTGLGLAISKRLAELLGGDVRVTSRPGTGSTFTLAIDAGPLQDVPMIEELAHQTSANQAFDSSGAAYALHGHVLLTEDNMSLQRLTATYLRNAGLEVTTAENGAAAVELARAEPFDLIVMDMQMPLMDGYTAVSMLRSKGYTAPIIALTADAMAQDRERCLRAGCSDYLSKPFSREALLEMVATQLGIAPTPVQDPGSGDGNAASASAAPNAEIVGPLVSTRLNDRDVGELIPDFVHELPPLVAQLHQHLAEGDLRKLASVIHQLKGTGTLYGFAPITERSITAEQAIKSNQALTEIRRHVGELMQLIRRVQDYDPNRENSRATESPHR